jgi:6-phosphofructokinase 1
MMRVGILTGGGDCPGLNPAIRGATLRLIRDGHTPIGILQGWKGLVEGLTVPLTDERVDEIIREGGTILGTSRTNPFKNPADLQRLLFWTVQETRITSGASRTPLAQSDGRL